MIIIIRVRMFRATKRWTVSCKIYRIIESNNKKKRLYDYSPIKTDYNPQRE